MSCGGEGLGSAIVHELMDEMPSFFVRLVFVARYIRREDDGGADVFGDPDRHDVPDFLRDDVDRHHVGIAGVVVVGLSMNIKLALIRSLIRGEVVSGFDLDAEKASSVLENEVVARGIAPGFGDDESEGRGFGGKEHFNPFAAALGQRE